MSVVFISDFVLEGTEGTPFAGNDFFALTCMIIVSFYI